MNKNQHYVRLLSVSPKVEIIGNVLPDFQYFCFGSVSGYRSLCLNLWTWLLEPLFVPPPSLCSAFSKGACFDINNYHILDASLIHIPLNFLMIIVARQLRSCCSQFCTSSFSLILSLLCINITVIVICYVLTLLLQLYILS